MRHLVSTMDLSDVDLTTILNEVHNFISVIEGKERPAQSLQNRHILLAFFEPSTRTRLSFQLSAHRLGASTALFQPEGSSVEKGESFGNTFATINAMHFDAMVMRHAMDGAVSLAASLNGVPVISAGEGKINHPTQGLLDASTLLERFGELRGLKICLVGDIEHSRVARSQIDVCSRLGATFALCAPKNFLPDESDEVFASMPRFETIEDALVWADVMSMLRIQRERISSPDFPDLNDYTKKFALTMNRLNRHNNVSVIHPGPANVGVEIEQTVIDSENSLIKRQVTHGVAVRMAVLNSILT